MQQTFQEVVGLSVLIDPEEKTEMGEAHVNSLAREAAENRLWLPQHGQLFMRDPAREYEDVSPRSQPTQGSIQCNSS